jgi:DNA-directed RNA polymerase II subunit RPB11
MATDATFFFDGDDHTLGNLICSRLVDDPEIAFAAYKVPHPLKRSVEIRAQTIDGPVGDRLEAAICSLLADINAFEEAFGAQTTEEN